jgi:nucleoside-diphosphate-sugar epimerase
MDDPVTTGEIYNVGSRNWISVLELARRVLELTGSSSELVYVPYDQVYGLGIDDMLHRVPAIERSRRARSAGRPSARWTSSSPTSWSTCARRGPRRAADP